LYKSKNKEQRHKSVKYKDFKNKTSLSINNSVLKSAQSLIPCCM